MKLRNKKTGEIMELECITIFDRPDKYNTGDAIDEYYTIDDLNECWEDYKPAEPLIKDEKIRKAVRAWAELNCSHKLHQFNDYQLEDENQYLIEFADSCFTNLKIGKNYTIAELCGEED